MVKKNEIFIRNRSELQLPNSADSKRLPLNLDLNDISPVLSFETKIPLDMANYYGIRMIIEYAEDLETPGWTVYDVWLSDKYDKVREYQYSDSVHYPCESADIRRKILEHANSWLYFLEVIADFAEELKRRNISPEVDKYALAKQRTQKARKHKG